MEATITISDSSDAAKMWGVPHLVTLEQEGYPPEEFVADSLDTSLLLAAYEFEKRKQ